MRTIQLDQNSGGKKIRNHCNDQGKVRCRLLPKQMRNAPDDDVAAYTASKGYWTLTFDLQFLRDAAPNITICNHGVILLRTDDPVLLQVSTRTAPKILQPFKDQFPEWHTVDLRNSLVEITRSFIHVYLTSRKPVPNPVFIDRSVPGWQDRLKAALDRNANSSPGALTQ